jgi:hypothetical protein
MISAASGADMRKETEMPSRRENLSFVMVFLGCFSVVLVDIRDFFSVSVKRIFFRSAGDKCLKYCIVED